VAAEFGITGVPLLTDADTRVSQAYDVMQYALESGEPSHTFVLVGADGSVLWVKDYGAPDNPDRTMYVEPAEIIELIRSAIQ
jgi:hypothetical protein